MEDRTDWPTDRQTDMMELNIERAEKHNVI